MHIGAHESSTTRQGTDQFSERVSLLSNGCGPRHEACNEIAKENGTFLERSAPCAHS